jgi:hypothetical protein
MPNYDVHCKACEYEGVLFMTLEELEKFKEKPTPCPLCKSEGTLNREYRKAPAGRVKGDKQVEYFKETSGIRKRCKEHFVKSGEMDQVRNKFGNIFDESLVSAAADRIRSGKGKDNNEDSKS